MGMPGHRSLQNGGGGICPGGRYTSGTGIPEGGGRCTRGGRYTRGRGSLIIRDRSSLTIVTIG